MRTRSPYRTPNLRAKSAFRAFTLVELLVVLAVVATLLALQLPGLARVQTQSRQAQCAANLRQLALVEISYANDFQDRLPSDGGGFWIWDTHTSVTDSWGIYGAQRRQFYCPANQAQNADGLWNAAPGFRIVGYSLTLPSTPSLISSNANPTIFPAQIVAGGIPSPAELSARRVLVADVIMSGPNQNNPAQRLTYQYTGIQGGYAAPGWQGHRTSHLDVNGRYPAGGNVAMLDGHVEWRNFSSVLPRTSTGSAPIFWW